MKHYKETIILMILAILTSGMLYIVWSQIKNIQINNINLYVKRNRMPSEQIVQTTYAPKGANSPSPSATAINITKPTTRPTNRISQTKKPVANPQDTCSGVYYNNQCYSQSCIDLDAPGMQGYDGDQYATKSSIIWRSAGGNFQYQNTDYCNENGNVIEHVCTKKADGSLEAASFIVTDSKCVDGQSVYN